MSSNESQLKPKPLFFSDATWLVLRENTIIESRTPEMQDEIARRVRHYSESVHVYGVVHWLPSVYTRRTKHRKEKAIL